MDLKDFLGNDKKELYWAVVLEPGWVQAGIWQISDGRAEVLWISPATAWELEEDLINASDTALSAAVQNLPEETAEPEKTVFGVPPSWVSEGQIKPEYLEKIKKICANLSLTPSGFVVLPEGLANLFKSEEGGPLNAVVLGMGNESIEVAVFSLGNLVGTTSVARSVSLADDVTEGLSRFSGLESLPSRIILYDGKEGELEDAKQELLKVQWDEIEKLKFLHTPKVETISPEKKVLATALAGASEIANVSKVENLRKKYVVEEEAGGESEIDSSLTEPSAQEMGFVVGQDVGEVDKNVERTEPQAELLPGVAPEGPTGRISFRPLAFGFLEKLKEKLPSLSFEASGRKTLLTGLVFLILLLLAGFVFWWFYPSATVTIYVSPQRLEGETGLTVDSDVSSPDFSKGVLPGEVVTTSLSGEKTKATSGTKTVGERAKGSVQIRNGTDTAINFPAGTILTATNDLRFSTMETASVSAAISTDSPGTATVEVEAVNIGAEYNLAKNEIFSVGNYPKADADAVSLSDFSGGTSREISAVSEEDQETLTEELTEELLSKAKEEFGGSLSVDKFLIEESLSGTPASTSFNSKVGDEASTLLLNLTLNVSGVAVNKTHLFDFAREILKSKTPGGYVLREDQLIPQFDLTDEEDGVYEFDVTFVANLLPEIKTDEIAQKLAGRYPPLAEEYLSTIPGFSRAEIRLKPRFPGRLGVIPRVVKNIQIEVAAER